MLSQIRERNSAAYLALRAQGPAKPWAKAEARDILAEQPAPPGEPDKETIPDAD